MGDNDFQSLLTEQRNAATMDIDTLSTYDILARINEQDKLVPLAVEKVLPEIAKAVDMLAEAIDNDGHMIYVGAGTSGRLGVLDASECPPTFNTGAELVRGYIAGGDYALRNAVEGGEDDMDAGRKLVHDAGITDKDVLIGISASGGAPYVLAAVEEAKRIGARTIGVATNADSKLSRICDIMIAPVVGPEVITGSTRMKSGTAQKLVLNMLTTGTMIKLGKVYGNLMVDMRASNVKLRARAVRMVRIVTDADETAAQAALEAANGRTKLAILMLKTGLDATAAQRVLDENHDNLRAALRR